MHHNAVLEGQHDPDRWVLPTEVGLNGTNSLSAWVDRSSTKRLTRPIHRHCPFPTLHLKLMSDFASDYIISTDMHPSDPGLRLAASSMHQALIRTVPIGGL